MEMNVPSSAENPTIAELGNERSGEVAPIGGKAARHLKPNRWVLIFLLVAYLAAIPFAYRYAANQARNPDPFLYAQVAKEMLLGKRLYSETWQDKPPLAFLFYEMPQALGFGAYPNIGFFLGILLVVEGAIFFIYFRRDPMAALASLFFVTLFPLTNWDLAWPSTEHFADPFVALLLLSGLTILRRRRFVLWQAAAIGGLSVIAFHVRQNAALAGLLPLLAIMYSDDSLRRKIGALALFATVAAVCWGAIILWLWRVGDISGYLYTVFEYPRLYARLGSPVEWLRLLDAFLATQLPLLLLLPVGIILLGDLRWPVIVSLAIAIVMVVLPVRSSGHYLASWFPFIAIYIALAMENSIIARGGVRWVSLVSIILLGVTGAAEQLRDVADRPMYDPLVSVSEMIEKAVPPNATLLVCGGMESEGLVYVSSLNAANTYSFMFQINPPQSDILPKSVDQIFSEYLEHPPDVIFISDDYYNEVVDQSVAVPSNPARLVRLLLGRYWYRATTPNPEFHFLIRIPDPGQAPAMKNSPSQ
jgi:hypothetical protein